MKNQSTDLERQCESIRKQLQANSSDNGFEIVETALDLEFTIDARGEYLGASILCAFGGPNIWIDTRYDRIDGYWGDEHVCLFYSDSTDIHDYCAQLMPQ